MKPTLSFFVFLISLMNMTTAAWSDTGQLTIVATEGAVAFMPESLVMKEGAQLAVIVQGEEPQALQETMFIRRNGIARVEGAEMRIVAEKAGQTQLFVIRGDQAYILPLEVEPGESKPVLTPEETAEAAADDPQWGVYAAEKAAVQDLVKYRIQAFDDRTDLNDEAVYPAAEVLIQIPALGYSGMTNSRGELELYLPGQGRFMMYATDRSGRFMNAQKEINLSANEDGRIRFNVMRFFNFNLMTTVTGSVQDMALGSLCGTLRLAEGAESGALTVELNQKGDGPFYFNRLGFIDFAVEAVEANGRFCFFNVEEGLAALSVKKDAEVIYTQPHFFVGGFHQDDEITLNDQFGFGAQVSVQPSVERVMASPGIVWNQQSGSMNVMPFGVATAAGTDAYGFFGFPGIHANENNPRLFTFVDEADLTPTIYQLPPLAGAQEQPLLPIYPRGFVEDLALQTSVVLDDRFGTVMAHYRYLPGERLQAEAGGTLAVDVKLYNALGQEIVGQYLSAGGEEAVAYLNVPPGYYQFVVMQPGKGIVDVQSVYVYTGALSSLVSGAKPQLRQR